MRWNEIVKKSKLSRFVDLVCCVTYEMETNNCNINGFRENGVSVLGQNVKSMGILIYTPTGDSLSKKDGKKNHRVAFNVNGRKLRPGEEEEGKPKPLCRSSDTNCWDVNNNGNKRYDSLIRDIFVTINTMSLLSDFPQTGLANSTVGNGRTRAHPVAAPKRSTCSLELDRSGFSELILPMCPRSGFLADTTLNRSKTQRKLNELQTSMYSCSDVSFETKEETEQTCLQISEVNNYIRVISREPRRNLTSNIEERVEIIPIEENRVDSNTKLENGNERSVEETNCEPTSKPKPRGESDRHVSNEAYDIIHNLDDKEPKTSHESNIRFGPSKLCTQFFKPKFPKSTKQSVLIGDVVHEVNAHGRESIDVNKPGMKRPVTIGKIKTMRSVLG
ncbi:hypothetical protein CHS0354_034176, partial [Potamilus streckersoni]